MKSPMRKSQQKIFWKNHKVIEFRKNGKPARWFGKRFPKTAQEIIDEENLK